MKHDIERRGEILSEILQNANRSKAEYAIEHNVAEITINRDLQWLRRNGINVYSKNGKVVIVDKIPTNTLNRILSEYLSVKLNTDFYLDKIKTLSKSHPNIYFQNLIKISKAVQEKRYIKIHYARIKDNTKVIYKVKPVKLRLSGFNWIMSAIKNGESLVKNFYITRIHSIDVYEEHFTNPSSKQPEKEKEKIILKFSKSVKNQLIDKIWFPEFELTEDEDGNIILKTEHEINNSLASWCISWWNSIEIINPESLKEYIYDMFGAFAKKNKN